MHEPEQPPVIGSYLLILTKQSLKYIEEDLQLVGERGKNRQQFPVIIEIWNKGTTKFALIGLLEFNTPADAAGDYVALLPELNVLPDSGHLADSPAELIEKLAGHAGFELNSKGRWVEIKATAAAA